MDTAWPLLIAVNKIAQKLLYNALTILIMNAKALNGKRRRDEGEKEEEEKRRLIGRCLMGQFLWDKNVMTSSV